MTSRPRQTVIDDVVYSTISWESYGAITLFELNAISWGILIRNPYDVRLVPIYFEEQMFLSQKSTSLLSVFIPSYQFVNSGRNLVIYLGWLHFVSRYIVSIYCFECNWRVSRYICNVFKSNCNFSKYFAKVSEFQIQFRYISDTILF